MKNGSAVLIGGFSGGILRAALGLVVVTPIATLLVNLVGAFLLSFWTYWGIERGRLSQLGQSRRRDRLDRRLYHLFDYEYGNGGAIIN